MTDAPDQYPPPPVDLDAVAAYLERHPEIAYVVITEVTEEWFA